VGQIVINPLPSEEDVSSVPILTMNLVPSVLIFGFIHTVPLHVVVALCEDHLRIVTVYIPDESLWREWRKRRTSKRFPIGAHSAAVL
jgi:hypothetical protein